MPHTRKNGQPCSGRPYQEASTMTIKCATCREPIGPPPMASKKPVTIAASAQGVNELLRRRLHPEEKVPENPYAEAKVGSTQTALDLIRQKAKEKQESGTAVLDIAAVPPDAELLTAGDPPMAPPVLPPSPSADIVTAPLDSTPPLMAALQQAAAEGDAIKAAEPPQTAIRRTGRR